MKSVRFSHFSLITIITLFFFSFSGLAQGIGFDKTLREYGDRVMPFCINNTVSKQCFFTRGKSFLFKERLKTGCSFPVHQSGSTNKKIR